MKLVLVQRDQATPKLSMLCLILLAFAQAQNTNTNSSSSTDEEDGLGGAELVAIGVCSLIVIAFCLVCCIMVRNAKKRKSLAEQQKEGGPKQRAGSHNLSET